MGCIGFNRTERSGSRYSSLPHGGRDPDKRRKVAHSMRRLYKGGINITRKAIDRERMSPEYSITNEYINMQGGGKSALSS